MPKGSEELTNARKEEIINACTVLYEKMRFKEITIKEISNFTSFARTSIYNYFQTKEEIFLALLKREYECWVENLNAIIEDNDTLTKDALADALAHSLEKRTNMLKLLAMNLYDIEENSRLEALVEFKIAYGNSMTVVNKCLEKFCPEMTALDKKEFTFAFFPFVYGIYPYSVVTEKQRKAMEKANVKFVYLSIYEIAYAGAKKLLGI